MSNDIENDRIALWMEQLANDSPEQSHRPLPDPDLLWMKAQLLDRQAAVERAMKPVEWCETIAKILVGFSACLLALSWTKVLAISGAQFLDPTWLSVAASLLFAAIAMLTYPIWAGDQ